MDAQAVHWNHAIDRMLSWKSSPREFEPSDEPAADVLEAAIDYAVDQRQDAMGVAATSGLYRADTPIGHASSRRGRRPYERSWL